MRCFKCNSEEHLKARCPLLKTHVSKDKDKKLTTKFGSGAMFVDASEDDVLVVSELESSKGSENLCTPLACCNNAEAKEDALSKSTTIVDEAESVKIVEYSKIDEINLDGFNLMAESTMQEKVDVGISDCSFLTKKFGKFHKPVITTNVQDGACSVAILENVGRITSLPQRREEGSA